jgi:ribosomal protein S18 acetylase RimI-like enzyme
MMAMRLADVVDYYRRHGMLQFSKRLLEGLGLQFFDRTLIFVLVDLERLPSARPKPYSFCCATSEDIEKEQHYKDGWFTKEEALKRIRVGRRLYILKDGGRFVSFLWAEPEKATVNWFDLHMVLPRDIVYCTGSYTVPDYRNRGIATQMDLEVFHSLKEEGVNYILGVVAPDNSESRAVNNKNGIIEYQVVRYRRYGIIRYFRINRTNSDEQKTFVAVFKTPSAIWNTFLSLPSAGSRQEKENRRGVRREPCS